MKEIRYDFVDLDSDESFSSLGKSFNGVLQGQSLHFNNPIVQGELTKKNLEPGLWMRKWKLTVFQKIILHRLPIASGEETKFSLIYFLNPALFDLKTKLKKIVINGKHNIFFASNEIPVDFSVVSKQPFYVFEIAFTASWLSQQFDDADLCFKNTIDQYLANAKKIITRPCNADEYQMLHELEISTLSDKEDLLFTRSRIYNLIYAFFRTISDENDTAQVRRAIQYEQIIQAHAIISENVQALPKLETIAANVNMSMSSLLRQFKMMFGKSIHQYYVEKKMELAKRMLLQERMTVKEIADQLGYKQASPFIDDFTRFHGYSPGRLKALRN